MPFIHIAVGRKLDPIETRRLGQESTRLIATILNKRTEVTSVLVESANRNSWTIGGEAIDSALTPVHCTLFITAGTNSTEEKAQAIAAVHRMLVDEIGALPEASYTVIHEIAAGDWGYDGQTQAARRAAFVSL